MKPFAALSLALLSMSLLLFGCISLGGQIGNETNATPPANNTTTIPPTNITVNESQNVTQNQTNQTLPPPKVWERYAARGFSFEYPLNMEVQSSNGTSSGIFSGTHELEAGQTGEILIVTYINTKAAYGANKDEIFKDNPTKAASDFLKGDKASDPAGSLLSKAYEIGDISTFSVARDGYSAEASFKIKFSDDGKIYTGYAMDIYVPERSLLARMRLIALDSAKAKEMRDNFLLSFRLEQQ